MTKPEGSQDLAEVPASSRRRSVEYWVLILGLVLAAAGGVMLAVAWEQLASPPSHDDSVGNTKSGTEMRPSAAPRTTTLPSVTPPESLFQPSAVEGGGFQNVVALGKSGELVLAGGDVAGMHRSSDGGNSFQPANEGLDEPWSLKIATIAIDPDDPDHVVAGAGFQGQTGGIVESDDGGMSWHVLTTQARFSGNNNPRTRGIPSKHPRSTGRLLVFGPGGELYAGTFDQGLMRSVDGGANWTTLGLDGAYIRGLALSDDGTQLWVATHGAGVHVVEDAAGVGRPLPVTGSPAVAEELALDGDGRLLVAAGQQGLAVRSADGGWTASVSSGTGTWNAVAVSSDGTFYAAGHDVPQQRGGRPTILRSDDRGVTWLDVSDTNRLDTTVKGTDRSWWLAEAQEGFLPTGGGFTAGQLAIPEDAPSTVWLAGRSGLWTSPDRGEGWQPAVAGLGVTANDAIAVDDETEVVVVANTDYRALVSDDGLDTVRASKVGATAGLDVVVAPIDGQDRFVLSTGERDGNRDGDLWVATDPLARNWSNLDLAVSVSGRRTLAVTGGRDRDGVEVQLAAVEGAGVWRRRDGVWSQVATEPLTRPQASANAEMLWLGDETVVLLDRASGLWESHDAGLTWQRTWDFDTNTRSTERTGFLAWHAEAEALYVSLADGLHRVDQATDDVGVERKPERLSGVRRPGPVAIDTRGNIWVASRPGGDQAAGFLVSCDDGRTWRDLADSEYAGAAINPSALSFMPDGTALLALGNGGVLKAPKLAGETGPGGACQGDFG